MSRAMKPKRPIPGTSPGPGLWQRPSRPNGGLHLLPFATDGDGDEPQPATDASWAWSVRRFARHTVWLLPGYALLFGVVTLFGDGAVPFSTDGHAFFLVLWAVATGFGLLAALVLTGLLVTARSRGTATVGLLLVLAGIALTLPFGALASQNPGGGVRTIALVGGAGYTAGWVLIGWAVTHSGVFNYADGWLLVVAAPLIGVGGLAYGPLQTLGAFLVLAAGIGVAWRAGRLVPRVGPSRIVRTITGEAEVVVARVSPGSQLANP